MKASNGISEIPISELPNLGSFKITSSDGSEYKVATHVTAKRISSKSNSKNQLIEVTVIADTSKDPVTRVGSNRPAELWDQTYGVRAYSTIYYDLRYFGDTAGYLLTNVSGGFQISDGDLGVLNPSGGYGCWGRSVTGTTTSNQTGRISFNGLTFNQSTGFTKYITLDTGADMFGCSTTATINELGTSNTWFIQLDNNL